MTRVRLGMITPSSNTVLEPVTAAMLQSLPETSAHFARFRVTRIALGADALAQFDLAPILEAARMLADARMDVIAWSGTSASWLGFDSDRLLCAAITAETGIPATTSVLALNEALAAFGARNLGLVTPYTGDVQQRIMANYAAAGLPVVAERHLDDPGNYSFANYEAPELADLIRDVASARPDAITTLCTNLRSTAIVPELEAETGILILDSIAVVVWKSLLLAGVAAARVEGWGRLFSHEAHGSHPSRNFTAPPAL